MVTTMDKGEGSRDYEYVGNGKADYEIVSKCSEMASGETKKLFHISSEPEKAAVNGLSGPSGGPGRGRRVQGEDDGRDTDGEGSDTWMGNWDGRHNADGSVNGTSGDKFSYSTPGYKSSGDPGSGGLENKVNYKTMATDVEGAPHLASLGSRPIMVAAAKVRESAYTVHHHGEGAAHLANVATKGGAADEAGARIAERAHAEGYAGA